MPFPIQRFQTHNGREFTAYKVQELLFEWGIKFRPIRPAAPHLNGKVEYVQKTVLDEFYATVDLEDTNLTDEFEAWQFYYNWQRAHGSLERTPIERCCELLDKIPLTEEVCIVFDEIRERKIRRQRTLKKMSQN